MTLTDALDAVRVGVQAGIARYNARATVPQPEYGFETRDARIARYWLYDSYENNTAYSSFNTQALEHKVQSRLYKHIDGLYNPVARLVALFAAFVYGGSIDFEHLTSGAIPIVSDDDALLEAIKQVFIWSQWGQNKTLFVRNGVVLGDSPIWVCDDRERQKVRLETVHPSRIRQAEFDEVGNVKSAVIEYQACDEEDLTQYKPGYSGYASRPAQIKYYTKTLTATKDEFVTYKNGQEFAFYKDANGKPITRWENEYGFIPLVIGGHKPTNMNWNANAFYNCVGKIDKINDVASLLNHSIRKIIIPALYAAGVSKNAKDPNGLKFDTDESDTLNLIYGPKESALSPINIPIDIPGALQDIRSMLDELEYDLPVLALQRIREKGGNMTAPGIKSGYSDAIGLVTEAMGQYDHTTVKALQMAVSIGGYNGYEGFESFNLDSYDRGDLGFWIKDRPVIADELGRSEKLTFLGQISSMSPPLQELALQEMNYDEASIQKVVEYTTPQAQQQSQLPAGGAGQGVPLLPSGQPAQNGKPAANGNHPANNADQFSKLTAKWQQLGIGGALGMGAQA